jgi:hypothetical protein
MKKCMGLAVLHWKSGALMRTAAALSMQGAMRLEFLKCIWHIASEERIVLTCVKCYN